MYFGVLRTMPRLEDLKFINEKLKHACDNPYESYKDLHALDDPNYLEMMYCIIHRELALLESYETDKN
ncbi:MAG TPA: hypothetical protein VLE02_01270 [Nitrosarchaeum sp.]|nr:hypothetical protein [Nitrosarchaeum sp.]